MPATTMKPARTCRWPRMRRSVDLLSDLVASPPSRWSVDCIIATLDLVLGRDKMSRAPRSCDRGFLGDLAGYRRFDCIRRQILPTLTILDRIPVLGRGVLKCCNHHCCRMFESDAVHHLVPRISGMSRRRSEGAHSSAILRVVD